VIHPTYITKVSTISTGPPKEAVSPVDPRVTFRHRSMIGAASGVAVEMMRKKKSRVKNRPWNLYGFQSETRLSFRNIRMDLRHESRKKVMNRMVGSEPTSVQGKAILRHFSAQGAMSTLAVVSFPYRA